MDTDYQFIDVSQDGPVSSIRLQRGDRSNALSLALLEELLAALEGLAPTSTRVIIIEGDPEAFSVGHDLTEMVGGEEPFLRALFATCTLMMEMIQQIPQPVIAKVSGIAVAAGCQLVAACDLVVAADCARFGTTGLRVGMFCSTPMVPLSRSIGRKRALEMLLTAVPIDARQAADWGLVNRVVPQEDLDEVTAALARQIAAHPPNVVGLGKRAFYQQVEMTEAEAYKVANQAIVANAIMQDGQAGMAAFLAKRPPVWSERD